MDASVLAIIAAGGAVIGIMAWRYWPQPEDCFEREMAELASLTTVSRTSPADHCADPPTTGGPVEDDGLASFIHQSAPTPIGPIDGAAESPCPVGGPVAISADEFPTVSCPPTLGGAADVPPSGSASFIHPVWQRDHVISCPICRSGQTRGGCGGTAEAVPGPRPRPILSVVKS